jgi:molybdopterin-synthase adenylyltransferase
MCGNIINLQRAALESAPGAIHHLAAGVGYLEGVNDPAVFWLNGICASTAVGVIHGMVSGFVNVDAGIDWIYEFPHHEWRKTNTEYLQTEDCYFCSHPQ